MYEVLPADAGRRIRQLLASRLGLSRALIQRLRENNRVKLNEQAVYLTQFAQAGDLISVDLVFDETSAIVPEAMDLNVIFEDADFLVLNKPPGILVHPVGVHNSGTLANGVMYRWQQQGIASKFRPIHRIDRYTSGVVVVGKNQFAHQALYKQLSEHCVDRVYLGLVQEHLTPLKGTIDAPIARDPKSIIARCVADTGQSAITHYEVIRTYQDISLLKLRLTTGRTHQIRVHLSYIGHPLLGDTLYGGTVSHLKRQALHSFKFGFVHPRTKQKVCFTAPLPPDLLQIIRGQSVTN
ncbi:MAG: RluA family pseudouridine synthase [Peptococcaceae bacterium]|nr:RluA family pseudouridine synthase [Peptococcaceae bacterium]